VWQVQTAIGAALLVTAIGTPAATLVARAAGETDPSCVIVDEVAGQIFALIGCPINWKAAIAGFVLFRIFDITKPFPLRRLERLPEGFGIMMDDVGAGLYALIVLRALIYFGIAR
jgi:phosphatidylglycerophosphatase A